MARLVVQLWSWQGSDYPKLISSWGRFYLVLSNRLVNRLAAIALNRQFMVQMKAVGVVSGSRRTHIHAADHEHEKDGSDGAV